MKTQIESVVTNSENAIKITNETATAAVEKHDWYDEKIAELIENASTLDSNIKDVSTDFHAIVKLQYDEDHQPHADLKGKRYIVLDKETNEEKIALFANNDILKISNETQNDNAAPSNIQVNDVLLGNEEKSLNDTLTKHDASIANNSTVLATKASDASLRSVAASVSTNETKIDGLNTRLSTAEQTLGYYVPEEHKLKAEELKLTNGGSTVVLSPDGTGSMVVTDAFGSNNYGKIMVSDVVISETSDSGETDSVKAVIADVRLNSDNINAIETKLDTLQDDFDSIYNKSGKRITVENGNFST